MLLTVPLTGLWEMFPQSYSPSELYIGQGIEQFGERLPSSRLTDFPVTAEEISACASTLTGSLPGRPRLGGVQEVEAIFLAVFLYPAPCDVRRTRH